MQISTGIESQYFLLLCLFIIIAVWGFCSTVHIKHAFAKLTSIATPNPEEICGYATTYWIEHANRQSDITLEAKRVYALCCFGYEYLLVDGIVHYVTLGRFSPLAGQSSNKCLIAVEHGAREALFLRPKMFKQLIVNDTVSVFSIHKLSAFVNEALRSGQISPKTQTSPNP